MAVIPESLHDGRIFRPGLRVFDDDLKLFGLQVWHKLGITKAFVVAHVAVETWTVYEVGFEVLIRNAFVLDRLKEFIGGLLDVDSMNQSKDL